MIKLMVHVSSMLRPTNIRSPDRVTIIHIAITQMGGITAFPPINCSQKNFTLKLMPNTDIYGGRKGSIAICHSFFKEQRGPCDGRREMGRSGCKDME